MEPDAFTLHALKLLYGHRKRGTRLVHLVCSHLSVATLLCAMHAATHIALNPLCFCVFVAYARLGCGRLSVGVLSSTVVSLTALWLSTADTLTLLLSWILCGVVELGSHRWFDDGERNVITRHRKGADKVLAVVLDVIFPAPMFFLHLALVDFGLVNGQSIAALAARAEKMNFEEESQAHVALPGFAWVQVPPHDTEGGAHATFATERLPPMEMERRAREFYSVMDMRRSLRFYSTEPVPEGVIERCIETAATAPSGAHKQPWTFVLVRDPDKKEVIRALVEAEERVNYDKRMKETWVNDVEHLTGARADARLYDDGAPTKPYLTEAPALIVVFKQLYGLAPDDTRTTNYYVQESCGIAVGILLAALQNVGLATLTSTPMGAERQIREALNRPSNEKVFLLLPVGFPASNATVPWRKPSERRKSVSEFLVSV